MICKLKIRKSLTKRDICGLKQINLTRKPIFVINVFLITAELHVCTLVNFLTSLIYRFCLHFRDHCVIRYILSNAYKPAEAAGKMTLF